MYQVEDEPLETIHLYVVREEERRRPSLLPLVVSLLALSLLITLGIVTPYTQPEIQTAIRVPAVPSLTKTFSAAVTIVPTGVKSYPATVAHGTLSIRNSSVIAQTIPAGFVVDGVATDTAVYVPGATADGDGVASVPAHSLSAGVNLPALSVNVVIGTSLFIRNLAPFTGGRPAYSVTFVTSQDRLKAAQQARAAVTQQISGLHYPCREEQSIGSNTVKLVWECQFVTYSLPSYMHAVSATLEGNYLVVDAVFAVHPKRIWVK
jgi:hypothetical protein